MQTVYPNDEQETIMVNEEEILIIENDNIEKQDETNVTLDAAKGEEEKEGEEDVNNESQL